MSTKRSAPISNRTSPPRAILSMSRQLIISGNCWISSKPKKEKDGTGSTDIIISVYDDKIPSSESTMSQETKRQRTTDEQEKKSKDEFINVQIHRPLTPAPQTTQGVNVETNSGRATSIHESKDESDTGEDERDTSEDEPDTSEDEPDTSKDEFDISRATPTRKSKNKPRRDRHIWWMHIETEITIGFFETAEDGVEFLLDHELDPFENNDGSYQAYFDTDENAYENPVFSFFYRRNTDRDEIITLEEVLVGRQICFEHDE